jgi:hypothetical protein
MKRLALFLLLVNLAWAGYFLERDGWTAGDAKENAPLNASRLSLRPPPSPPSRAADVPVAAPHGDTLPAYCVEWRGLAPVELKPVRELLNGMAEERVMSFSEVPLDLRHWVIFPPLPSREAATAKLAGFAAAGIKDAFVVKSGPWDNAISLGLYAKEEAARRRVRELDDKGIPGTRIEPQAKQGSDYYFEIRSEDADALKSLNEAKAAYPNSTLSRVACTP